MGTLNDTSAILRNSIVGFGEGFCVTELVRNIRISAVTYDPTQPVNCFIQFPKSDEHEAVISAINFGCNYTFQHGAWAAITLLYGRCAIVEGLWDHVTTGIMDPIFGGDLKTGNIVNWDGGPPKGSYAGWQKYVRYFNDQYSQLGPNHRTFPSGIVLDNSRDFTLVLTYPYLDVPAGAIDPLSNKLPQWVRLTLGATGFYRHRSGPEVKIGSQSSALV